jgi:hypothetical protein
VNGWLRKRRNHRAQSRHHTQAAPLRLQKIPQPRRETGGLPASAMRALGCLKCQPRLEARRESKFAFVPGKKIVILEKTRRKKWGQDQQIKLIAHCSLKINSTRHKHTEFRESRVFT